MYTPRNFGYHIRRRAAAADDDDDDGDDLKGATSRITQLEKAGKFFRVCHS